MYSYLTERNIIMKGLLNIIYIVFNKYYIKNI